MAPDSINFGLFFLKQFIPRIRIRNSPLLNWKEWERTLYMYLKGSTKFKAAGSYFFQSLFCSVQNELIKAWRPFYGTSANSA